MVTTSACYGPVFYSSNNTIGSFKDGCLHVKLEMHMFDACGASCCSNATDSISGILNVEVHSNSGSNVASYP